MQVFTKKHSHQVYELTLYQTVTGYLKQENFPHYTELRNGAKAVRIRIFGVRSQLILFTMLNNVS